MALKILGQDVAILQALWANILSWLFARFVPSRVGILLPHHDTEPIEEYRSQNTENRKILTTCVSIGRPGGYEQLRIITLKKGVSTVGYNIKHVCLPPFTPQLSSTDCIPKDCAVVRNHYFSVNYADCTIRWGLYESAKQFVGYPIVPGFDIAGEIEFVESNAAESSIVCATTKGGVANFQVGDRVFGCTLFGAYSSRVLVPIRQLRKIPDWMTMSQAAAIPAVALTALYALSLAGAWPHASSYRRKSVLVHSAAGGVGSMLVQMSKLLGLGPVVGVVGSTTKVEAAKSAGCDLVVDKSRQSLWSVVRRAVPDGFASIFDANGVSTLQQSYNHLAPTGRLIIFGFHSNLPLGRAMLSPIEWVRMAFKMRSMPKFDAMDMTVSNKSVLCFNLSFFAQEVDLVSALFDRVLEWLENRELKCPNVVEMDMHSIARAHELIQSGKSIGKIVLRTKI